MRCLIISFQTIYESWLSDHIGQRTGERKRKLIEGHGHAEKIFLQQVWYPAFQQFEQLHPEYEITDFRNGSRFLDFAYVRFPLRLAIEIDGFGPHASRASRWQFADSLMRQNQLTIDGWRILRFSFDDVQEKARACQQVLHQFMGTWFGISSGQTSATEILEKEVIRLALCLNRPLRPRDVCESLQIPKGHAHRILRDMVNKKKLIHAGKGEVRIRLYEVNLTQINEKTWH